MEDMEQGPNQRHWERTRFHRRRVTLPLIAERMKSNFTIDWFHFCPTSTHISRHICSYLARTGSITSWIDFVLFSSTKSSFPLQRPSPPSQCWGHLPPNTIHLLPGTSLYSAERSARIFTSHLLLSSLSPNPVQSSVFVFCHGLSWSFFSFPFP